jgi:DNA gyrase subunit A
VSSEEVEEFHEEDLIPHQDVVITVSDQGYIKRTPVSAYQKQHRGGVGVTGMVTRDTDMVRHCVVADTHDDLFLFTNRGKMYKLKVYDIPQDTSRATKGTALAGLISIDPKEQVTATVAARTLPDGAFIVMATSMGMVKKTRVESFASVRSSGIIAMKLRSGEELVGADIVSDKDEVMLVTRNGQAIRFAVKGIRPTSRTSGGVRGIRLGAGDCVVALVTVNVGADLLTVTEKGFGKRTPMKNFPLHRRGGKGVMAHRLNEKTGKLIAARVVAPSEHIIIISSRGSAIRIPVGEEIACQGRATLGVHLKRLEPDDRVASVACIYRPENKEGE